MMIRKNKLRLKLVLLLTVALAASGICTSASAAGGGSALTDPGAMEGKHFHPKGKMPSKFTIELPVPARLSMPRDEPPKTERQMTNSE